MKFRTGDFVKLKQHGNRIGLVERVDGDMVQGVVLPYGGNGTPFVLEASQLEALKDITDDVLGSLSDDAMYMMKWK